uniref:Uncharacterized protein n=1 Tax=Siphoviridae sp. ctLqe90 TaxID=2825456 RepID=A0A8S5Q353_9CAUD|nr:MAG TPA: hypothetical protein [Siphoviridae sp. ctLqe90]
MNRQTRQTVNLFPNGVEGSAPSSPTNKIFVLKLLTKRKFYVIVKI